ncbi:hypothetical protein [Bradyrhizobium sp. 153]|uniref:hypothetical protein n=1 Tax=Bradyrhizobium sp. 153 TaxID=2782627 RepID=UPI001FF79125|nr:hypothetical protein [Bradyrhizobium sp. 153]MCK1669406.1 hypothetical protein [Bradyrhizobium sp. 153]
MGLSARSIGETDATRRAALQIAVQLPENVEEARGVLAQASYLLENYLIRGPRPVERRSD